MYGATGSTLEGNTVGSNIVDSGTYTNATTATYGPTAIRGYVSAARSRRRRPRRLDRRGHGRRPPRPRVPASRVRRGQYGAGGTIPYVSLARASEKFTDQVGNRAYLRTTRSALCTDLFIETGTNDVYTDLVTLATLQTRALACWAQHGQAGQRLWQTTLVPRTSSTDFYATVTNQTTLSQETVRTGWNSWLYDGAPMQAARPSRSGPPGSTVSRCAVYDYTGTLVTPRRGRPTRSRRRSTRRRPWRSTPPAPAPATAGSGRPGYAIADSGTSSGSNSTTTLNDTSKSWTTNQHYGKRVVITSGTGSTEYGTVQSNTATALTIGGSWSVTPDATSRLSASTTRSRGTARTPPSPATS
jgi:hypothetical protein